MRFNLYIPHKDILFTWEKYAGREDRSTSSFIRHAVREYIRRTYLESKEETL